MIIEVVGESETKRLGERLGARLTGGEVFELIGDVGAGKTTFVKGLAKGLAVDDDVQSPSFTISRVYQGRDDLQLVHYDFYRLSDPGIMRNEVAETTTDPKTITVVEWASIVDNVLPADHIRLTFRAPQDDRRTIEIPDTLAREGSL